MASILSQEINSNRAVSGMFGKQLLDVITSGMYSDPRMAIREYIQNAADSIDEACEQGVFADQKSRIQITLDGRDRVITIEDNGAGIDGRNVEARLGNIGCSTKIGAGQRGFRGIGRLGGLTYCDVLQFQTRQSAREPVHIVEWNGRALQEQVSHSPNQEALEDAVRRIAIISSRRADRSVDPDRFFRVRLINVHRFHSDLLMNVKGLREYLSQTAPIAYKTDDFPFASRIVRHLHDVSGYCSYDITLNGAPVVRPYQMDVEMRESASDHIHDIELVECLSRKGELLCRGWFAQTGFLSGLPRHLMMRGLRIRQGNIAVGDEYFLRDLFSESRFATWQIGELHVTPLLKLNARRDGFEESLEYEEFLEWASILCRRLSGLCRQSSRDRSARQTKERLFKELEQQLSIPFFIDEEHLTSFIEAADNRLRRLRGLLSSSTEDDQKAIDSVVARLEKLHEHPVLLHSILDGRALCRKDSKQLLVELCKKIVSINHGSDYSGILLEILEPYLKSGVCH
jgi:hypothetical protein